MGGGLMPAGLTVPQAANRDALVAARRRSGLTTRQAAALLGVHRTTVRQWERGEHRPPTARVAAFVARLDAACAVAQREG
jgi:DNA-binding transcriptional regulator YiaG